jgi:DNA-binding transcriptional LysR family regulator
MDTLEALRLFVSIAETGSLSAAARQESVATSTVTVALQQLEEQARVSLITRSTRRLSFTFEGRRFLADARKLLADWDASIAGVQDGPLRGPIRITATQDFGRSEVAPLIDRFLEVHPAVQIALHLSDGVVDLVEQDIDVALRNGPLADSALKARLILRGRRVVCAAPSYWQAHSPPKHPDELSGHNCLVHPRPGSTFSAWSFTDDGKPLSVRVAGNRVANDGGVLRQWAIDGHGEERLGYPTGARCRHAGYCARQLRDLERQSLCRYRRQRLKPARADADRLPCRAPRSGITSVPSP